MLIIGCGLQLIGQGDNENPSDHEWEEIGQTVGMLGRGRGGWGVGADRGGVTGDSAHIC